MATRCCSARCSAERKGFRRELDSWRHKLIHCVGFESILEGIYGPRLLHDLSIFINCEPEATADWSTDARCSFCNLQLEKNSDRLPDSPPHAETPPQGINTSDTLQCQADQFLHAVLHKKEFPESCDPIIPLAAQELMRKMIRQFAVEYAHKIQTTENQNAITQTEPDGPLDLTLSRNTQCAQQDGVLDLSKKNTPSLNTLAQQRLSGRPIRDERLGRSTQFADGLLSKAAKDVRSGALDLHKAAILYGIPQNTLRLHADHTHSGAAPLALANHNGVPSSRTSLHTGETKTQTSWNRPRPDQSERSKPSSESAAAASLLHRLVCELRDRGDACNTPAGGSALLRIPQVRPGVTTPPSDLSGLVDAIYLNSKTSDRVKILLPKHSDCSATLESRPLQGDVPPPCVCARSAGGSASADECVEESERRDKQPRKKRGRYRQYDHDILEEAITMVMGGKMTVSKAQSVYGVPHSTLEYKVKERMGTLKTPPKKKLRPPEPGTSGTTLNASKRCLEEEEEENKSKERDEEQKRRGTAMEEVMTSLCTHHRDLLLDLLQEMKLFLPEDKHGVTAAQGDVCRTVGNLKNKHRGHCCQADKSLCVLSSCVATGCVCSCRLGVCAARSVCLCMNCCSGLSSRSITLGCCAHSQILVCQDTDSCDITHVAHTGSVTHLRCHSPSPPPLSPPQLSPRPQDTESSCEPDMPTLNTHTPNTQPPPLFPHNTHTDQTPTPEMHTKPEHLLDLVDKFTDTLMEASEREWSVHTHLGDSVKVCDDTHLTEIITTVLHSSSEKDYNLKELFEQHLASEKRLPQTRSQRRQEVMQAISRSRDQAATRRQSLQIKRDLARLEPDIYRKKKRYMHMITNATHNQVPGTSISHAQNSDMPISHTLNPDTPIPHTQSPDTPIPYTQSLDTSILHTLNTSILPAQTPDTAISHTPRSDMPISNAQSPNTPISHAQNTDTPVLNAQNLDTPILQAESLDTPISHGPSSDTPILSGQSLHMAISHTQTPDMPISHAQRLNTPISQVQSSDIPISQSRSPDKPISHTQTIDTPILDLQSPDMLISQVQRLDIPILQDQRPGTPISHLQSPDKPISQTQTPDTLISHVQNSDMPISQDQSPDKPLSHTQTPDTPISDLQSPNTPISQIQSPGTPILTSQNLSTPNLPTQSPDITGLHTQSSKSLGSHSQSPKSQACGNVRSRRHIVRPQHLSSYVTEPRKMFYTACRSAKNNITPKHGTDTIEPSPNAVIEKLKTPPVSPTKGKVCKDKNSAQSYARNRLGVKTRYSEEVTRSPSPVVTDSMDTDDVKYASPIKLMLVSTIKDDNGVKYTLRAAQTHSDEESFDPFVEASWAQKTIKEQAKDETVQTVGNKYTENLSTEESTNTEALGGNCVNSINEAEPTIKRRPGRPKKLKPPPEKAVKRPIGRPRKSTVDTNAVPSEDAEKQKAEVSSSGEDGNKNLKITITYGRRKTRRMVSEGQVHTEQSTGSGASTQISNVEEPAESTQAQVSMNKDQFSLVMPVEDKKNLTHSIMCPKQSDEAGARRPGRPAKVKISGISVTVTTVSPRQRKIHIKRNVKEPAIRRRALLTELEPNEKQETINEEGHACVRHSVRERRPSIHLLRCVAMSRSNTPTPRSRKMLLHKGEKTRQHEDAQDNTTRPNTSKDAIHFSAASVESLFDANLQWWPTSASPETLKEEMNRRLKVMKETWVSDTSEEATSDDRSCAPSSSAVRILFERDCSMETLCSWFMQTTETQSLAIIKKANNRNPCEVFQYSSSQASNRPNVSYSPQAERLRKCIKKFATVVPKSPTKVRQAQVKFSDMRNCFTKQQVFNTTPNNVEKLQQCGAWQVYRAALNRARSRFKSRTKNTAVDYKSRNDQEESEIQSVSVSEHSLVNTLKSDSRRTSTQQKQITANAWSAHTLRECKVFLRKLNSANTRLMSEESSDCTVRFSISTAAGGSVLHRVQGVKKSIKLKRTSNSGTSIRQQSKVNRKRRQSGTNVLPSSPKQQRSSRGVMAAKWSDFILGPVR